MEKVLPYPLQYVMETLASRSWASKRLIPARQQGYLELNILNRTDRGILTLNVTSTLT